MHGPVPASACDSFTQEDAGRKPGGRLGPTVREMTAMYELLPSPCNDVMSCTLDDALTRAMDLNNSDLHNEPYLYGIVTNVCKDTTPTFLSSLSQNTWRALSRRVFQDKRGCAPEQLDVIVFAVQNNLIRPRTGRWQANYATRLCNDGALRTTTLATWIHVVLHSIDMLPMLGPSVLAWRNRCIATQNYPLPRPGTPLMESYGVKHALATLLAVGSHNEIVEAFDRLDPVHLAMYHVLNAAGVSIHTDCMQTPRHAPCHD